MTWALVLKLWGNKYVRYAAAGVAVAVALYMVALHFENVGAAKAKAEVAQQTADAIERTHKSDRAEFVEDVKPILAAAENASKQASEAHELTKAIFDKQQMVASTVSSMSQTQIDDAIAKKVGDLNLPEVRRQILACHEELPLCEEKAKASADEAAKRASEAASWQSAYQRTSVYVDAQERAYASLWNATSTTRRSWRCLKLWRCVLPQVQAPSPQELSKGRPLRQTSAIQSGVTK